MFSSRHRHRPRFGFTLIELLVVCAIIGVLAAIFLSNVKRAIRKAREGRTFAHLNTVRTNLDLCRLNSSDDSYPPHIIYNVWLSAWADPYDPAQAGYVWVWSSARSIFGTDPKEAMPPAEVSRDGSESFDVPPHYFCGGCYRREAGPGNVFTYNWPSGNNRGWHYLWESSSNLGGYLHLRKNLTVKELFRINNSYFSTEGKRYYEY